MAIHALQPTLAVVLGSAAVLLVRWETPGGAFSLLSGQSRRPRMTP
jgi:hypothetical protein